MKQFFNTITHKLFWTLTCIFFWRVREVEVNGQPYLRRLYIFKRRGRFFNFPFAVYLHYFYNGDDARELHNHPWSKAKSFILTGGYTEFKRHFRIDPNDGIEKSVVLAHVYRSGSVNTICQEDFHRISLDKNYYGEHTWSLFFSAKRTSGYENRYDDWEFWDSFTDSYIPQGEFKNETNEKANAEAV